jgi:hypothetical protein
VILTRPEAAFEPVKRRSRSGTHRVKPDERGVAPARAGAEEALAPELAGHAVRLKRGRGPGIGPDILARVTVPL